MESSDEKRACSVNSHVQLCSKLQYFDGCQTQQRIPSGAEPNCSGRQNLQCKLRVATTSPRLTIALPRKFDATHCGSTARHGSQKSTALGLPPYLWVAFQNKRECLLSERQVFRSQIDLLQDVPDIADYLSAPKSFTCTPKLLRFLPDALNKPNKPAVLLTPGSLSSCIMKYKYTARPGKM